MIHASVDEYIRSFGGDTKARLMQIRDAIRAEAPEAEESIAYAMPAYKVAGKPLVYFAGYAGHIGFYATPNGHKAFVGEFTPYKQGKGSVQFPHNQPLPLDLVRRVVRFRMEQVDVDTASHDDTLPSIGAPATAALKELGVTRASDLQRFTEKELLAIHGIGPKAIRLLREADVQLKEE